MEDAEFAPLISNSSNPDLAVHHKAQFLARLAFFVSTCSLMVFSTSVEDDSIMILVGNNDTDGFADGAALLEVGGAPHHHTAPARPPRRVLASRRLLYPCRFHCCRTFVGERV